MGLCFNKKKLKLFFFINFVLLYSRDESSTIVEAAQQSTTQFKAMCSNYGFNLLD